MSEGKKKAPGAVAAATRGQANITHNHYTASSAFWQVGVWGSTDRIFLRVLRLAWRRMPRTERRYILRSLRDGAVMLGCISVAIGLPGWVEHILGGA